EFEKYRAANLPTEQDKALVREVLARGKDAIAAPEADVYKELTAEKPSDVVLFRTRFGTKSRSRYVENLSRAAKAREQAAAAATAAVGARSEVPLWQLMEDAGA